jgi:hypothetical protein
MDCLFEFPEHKNQMALMEIILSPDFSQSEILRESLFPGEGTHFSYEHELSRLHYSFDKRIALFDNADHGFVNYGFDKQVFDQGFSVTIIPYLPDNSSPNRSDYDYLLENNETVFDLWSSIKPENPFSGDSVYTFSSSLIRYNHATSDTSVIFTHEPVFIDSSTFTNTRIVDLRYTPGGTLLAIINEIEYQIEYIEDYNYYHGVESEHDMYLIEINSANSVDTLLSVPESDAIFPFTNLYISQNLILMSANQHTYEYNMTSGEMSLLYEGTIPRNMAMDEQSLTFDNGNKYYRFEDDYVFDLSAHFSNIAYSIPFQNLVAVQTIADRDKVFIFDINTEAIVHTITIDDLPEFNPVNGDSTYRLENPIFTPQGELILMHFRETYLTDEDYERRCG